MEIILSSLADGTNKQYQPYMHKWIEYCNTKDILPYGASIVQGIEFLTELYHDNNRGYSAINTARLALSLIFETVEGLTFGKQALVKRFMRGIFKLIPSLPRYTSCFDASQVLRFLQSMEPIDKISLENLTLKLVMLYCLLTAQRDQTLEKLTVTNMELTESKCTFYVSELLKTSKPGKHLAPLELKKYPLDINLCPVALTRRYLELTGTLRGLYIQLFIGLKPPHKPVTSSTLSRWCRRILKLAIVDKNFKSHSTRSAATSAALAAGVSLKEINRAAGWTNSDTFARFYQRPISENFGEKLLQNSNLHTV
eukprot:gene10385-11466_t